MAVQVYWYIYQRNTEILDAFKDGVYQAVYFLLPSKQPGDEANWLLEKRKLIIYDKFGDPGTLRTIINALHMCTRVSYGSVYVCYQCTKSLLCSYNKINVSANFMLISNGLKVFALELSFICSL